MERKKGRAKKLYANRVICSRENVHQFHCVYYYIICLTALSFWNASNTSINNYTGNIHMNNNNNLLKGHGSSGNFRKGVLMPTYAVVALSSELRGHFDRKYIIIYMF